MRAPSVAIMVAALVCLTGAPAAAAADSEAAPGTAADASADPAKERHLFVVRTCATIETEATRRAMPPAFLARLIWKESRFNPGAVSPKGASGIAQFMPATARERGLADPFDADTALAASAHYLADLAAEFGNLGLAAAAYNAGPNRVRRWRSGRTGLPRETRNFVLTITGLSAEQWTAEEADIPDFSLHATLPFAEACQAFASRARPMPRRGAATVAQTVKPWGVLIASHHSEVQARQGLERLRSRYDFVAEHEPVEIARRPNASRGGQLWYRVMLGVDDRDAGSTLCARLRREGGICMVVRN